MINTEPMRRQLKAGQNGLQMSDDAYRALLQRITGKTSSKQLSLSEINAVLDEYKRLGWKPVSKFEKQAKLIKFLWMQLGEASVLKNRSSSALIVFCNRFTNGKSIYKSSGQEISAIIEALKDWCKREGVSTGNVK